MTDTNTQNKPERSSGNEVESNDLLADLPNLPQRQDSTLDQLRDLYHTANHLGMCDAADLIRKKYLHF